MPPYGGNNSGPALGGTGFPALGLISQHYEGSYLVLTRTDDGETLERVSPFLIDKSIRNCCGEVASVKRIRDGKVLVKTKSAKQTNQLEKLKIIVPGINVTASEHATLNTCRFVITCRDLYYLNDEEILEGLREQKVTKVERIMKKVDGELVKTSNFILTMSVPVRPEKIKVAFISVPTRPYYPRPMRCFQCLRYGHLGRDCKSVKICANCGDNYHEGKCVKPVKCVNCEEQHPATSPNCPIWRKETDIVRVRIDQDISHYEARKIVEARMPIGPSYAEKAAVGAAGCKCKCTCIRTKENIDPSTVTPTAGSSKINPPAQSSTTNNNASIIASLQHAVERETKTSEDRTSSPKQKRVKKIVEISSDEKFKTPASQPFKTAKEPLPQLKRKPGRPRKNPLTTQEDTTEADEENSEMEIL
ncbi:uncharacterized protein LOC131679343 [Topomyia yanbarensis]|uniref:uncharacterized protein LOC131679343 n=1 Tax=Topomyia yanbarensis TaxID=2498891 RepID=UPI00273C9456|nr:uncharacterized protein LOC131679343 [Topomyia yanbarensis]